MLRPFAGLAIFTLASLLAIPASAGNDPHLLGQLAPELSIVGGLNGITRTTQLRGWRGEPVLIEFWSPSCRPCRKMLPKVEKLYRRYRKQGLHVLAISLGSQSRSKNVVKKAKLTMPIGFDTLQQTMASYKVKRIPATFLVDKDGVVRAMGTDMETAVKRELKRVVKKTPR